MIIAQTRPQGETSAVEGLARHGVPAISPTETVKVRRRAKGGKRETIDKKVRIMPGYIVADPSSAHQLDVALGSMRERDARRDVTKVVGFASDASLRHIMSRHGGVVEPHQGAELRVGQLARITAGAFAGFQGRIQALRANRARIQVGQLPAEVQVEHLEPVEPKRGTAG